MDDIEKVKDRYRRMVEAEKELARLKEEKASLSTISEQEYKLKQILLEGRVSTTFDKLEDKAERYNLIGLKIAELRAEIKELERQQEEIKKEGRPT